MAFLLASLLALAAQPPAPADAAPPPEDMVDFLGRRRLCLDLPEPAERNAFHQSEWRRLACGSLASEERMWRERHRGDDAARYWLDRDPRDFRMPGIVVSSYDGPPGAYVRRIDLVGTENGGQAPFRLSIDSDAENGAATFFTASFGDLPARTFRIDNARFEWLDLQSVRTALRAGPPGGILRVELRFGHRRGYCADQSEDDRPRLVITFHRDRILASYQDRTNCSGAYVSLTGAD